jgi:ADP-heptose:LPS heptosyltransferase
MKRVLVIRLGAYGDLVMITPLLKQLKVDGYHVTVNVKGYTRKVLEGNPNIDEFLIHDDSIPNKDLGAHWEKLGKNYDKVINLSGSIEDGLIKISDGERLNEITRERLSSTNYYDETMLLGGYPDLAGKNGELFFTDKEERFAQNFRKKYSKCFLVLWSLSGSSTHKSYPYTEVVARKLLDVYDDIVFVTVGDIVCQLLEWEHKRTIQRAGKWTIKKSMIITKYADLVIGPQTCMLPAAACFDTPKIVFLSHSTHDNLCKYWTNHECLHSSVECYPCHQIHYTNDSCVLDSALGTPICMTKLSPWDVYCSIEKQYLNWREQRNGSNTVYGEWSQAVSGRRWDGVGLGLEASRV